MRSSVQLGTVGATSCEEEKMDAGKYDATLETVGDCGGQEQRTVRIWNRRIAPLLRRLDSLNPETGTGAEAAHDARSDAWSIVCGGGSHRWDRAVLVIRDAIRREEQRWRLT